MLGSHSMPHLSVLDSPVKNAKMWHCIVSEFSRRNLTNEDDIFPAIAAIARKYDENDTYLAGLWQSNLAADLLWFVQRAETNTKRQRPAKYRAPSWSWAALKEPIGWRDHSEIDEMFEPDYDFKYLSYTPQLNSEEDPYSSLQKANLYVRGRLVYFGSVQQIKEEKSITIFFDEGIHAEYSEVYGLLLGWREYNSGSYWCSSWRTNVPCGLLLSEDLIDGKAVHHRVGIFLDSFLEKKGFESIIPIDLDLL